MRRATIMLLLLLSWMVAGVGAAPPAAAITGLPAPATELPGAFVTARAAIVVDADSGAVVATKAAGQRRAMASTTKIMTALIALERTRLPAGHPDRVTLADVVTVSANAPSAGGSMIGLRAGERITLLNLLYGLLLPSGNDAAVAIAEYLETDEPRFAEAMNRRAAELGLRDTNYVTVHGRDPEDMPAGVLCPLVEWIDVFAGADRPNCRHYSTARDLASLARIAMQDATFRSIVADPAQNVNSTLSDGTPRAYGLVNTNDLIRPGDSDFYAGADGIKTGTTDNAGACLVARATIGGRRVLTVVLGASDRYADSRALLDYGFDRFFAAPVEGMTSLASGYFNGDAYKDLAIGIPHATVNGLASAGKVVIVHGSATGLNTEGPVTYTEATAGVPGVVEAQDRFGWSLTVGDFDGNGRDDLAIGSPHEDVGTHADTGAMTIIYSGTVGLDPLAGADHINQATTGVPGTQEGGDHFAWSLAAADFDGDGRDDILVGVPGEDVGSTADAGAVNVFYGQPAGIAPVARATLVEQDTAGVPGEAEAGDRFGTSLAAADFDGDGRHDAAIGSPYENVGNAVDAGFATVLYGDADGLFSRADGFDQTTPGMPGDAETGDLTGFALATGDFDRDGRFDLAMGAPGEELSGTPAAGMVLVVYGTAGGLDAALGSQSFTQGTAGVSGSVEALDWFGSSLASGSFDGSGADKSRDDLAIGVPGENIGQAFNAGAVVTLHGGAGGLSTEAAGLVHQDVTGVPSAAEFGEQLGSSLTSGRLRSNALAIGSWGEHLGDATLDRGYTLVVYGEAGGLTPADNDEFLGGA